MAGSRRSDGKLIVGWGSHNFRPRENFCGPFGWLPRLLERPLIVFDPYSLAEYPLAESGQLAQRLSGSQPVRPENAPGGDQLANLSKNLMAVGHLTKLDRIETVFVELERIRPCIDSQIPKRRRLESEWKIMAVGREPGGDLLEEVSQKCVPKTKHITCELTQSGKLAPEPEQDQLAVVALANKAVPDPVEARRFEYGPEHGINLIIEFTSIHEPTFDCS